MPFGECLEFWKRSAAAGRPFREPGSIGRVEIRLNEGTNLTNTKVRSIVGGCIVRKPVRRDRQSLRSGGSRSSGDPFCEAYEVIRSPTPFGLSKRYACLTDLVEAHIWSIRSKAPKHRLKSSLDGVPPVPASPCSTLTMVFQSNSYRLLFSPNGPVQHLGMSSAAGAVPARSAPGFRALRCLLSPSGLESGVDEVKMFSLKTILDITKKGSPNLKPLSRI
ncbi:hypothetical protein CSOJ01_13966 [Colletotrichum sojae]|uniref:Uncharacterized protein n=1 Tax=Colletotrichum sojae TaxID=2175907 RepID=A0A8H6IRR3_9PEZI|nr:hypothetical protein CSOJ01_13966 [Colletotrichum sojae]